ncbi:MAG TPA: hypothetical protein PKI71_15070, partial [Candidatus Rifleibacterium sp.]|nr:hypothetical protein [Candidatus Rifleibacterium sp.]
ELKYGKSDFERRHYALLEIGFAEFEVIPPASYTRAGYDGSLDYEAGDAGDLGPYQPGQVRGKFIRYIVNPNDLPDGKLY